MGDAKLLFCTVLLVVEAGLYASHAVHVMGGLFEDGVAVYFYALTIAVFSLTTEPSGVRTLPARGGSHIFPILLWIVLTVSYVLYVDASRLSEHLEMLPETAHQSHAGSPRHAAPSEILGFILRNPELPCVQLTYLKFAWLLMIRLLLHRIVDLAHPPSDVPGKPS